MAVIIHAKHTFDGHEVTVEEILPKDILADEKTLQQAKKLDEELRSKIQKINIQFEKLSASFKPHVGLKWTWLGKQINQILSKSKHVRDEDIDDNIIWLAIRQYLIDDLRVGEKSENAGTNRDHLRWCYLFAKGPYKWVPSWGAWTKLLHRGSQLIRNKDLMKSLEKKFKPHKEQLSADDYDVISKLLVKALPSTSAKTVNIDFMDKTDIQKIVDNVYSQFIKNQKSE